MNEQDPSFWESVKETAYETRWGLFIGLGTGIMFLIGGWFF